MTQKPSLSNKAVTARTLSFPLFDWIEKCFQDRNVVSYTFYFRCFIPYCIQLEKYQELLTTLEHPSYSLLTLSEEEREDHLKG